MYLLDTNACIRILNGQSISVVERLRRQSPRAVYLCSIVKAELIYGAHRSARPAENMRLLNRFFEPYESLPFDDRCTEVYGRIRNELERSEMVIGPNDLMIAATAVTHRLVLVTANTRQFSRVINLEIENWELDK
ncbi:MAG TPA: type II toxin-antitoxin system VapC family toxin [Promineifilum sp.]|nr:type II toxin-antitoxin system VapC family toxin [Promineifilum sp.]HRO24483.1 type II toxin-antitoxin system VapC family toxin [Promineifilum sp.]HRO89171.1 type II toxin-antitoxin system VapC family toxin [Promineifilum sp.]HRQ12140.1 type II toxin-antitoxin system VapC family toxin [Promineifilum sp.]